MAREPLSLKARAIGLLAQREQSRAELKRKLLRIEQQRARQAAAARGHAAGRRQAEAEAGPGAQSRAMQADPADTGDDAIDTVSARENAVEALLDSLARDGYLDESRFVASRLHLRAGRFGAQRIQQELAQHGLRLDADQQAALRASELDRAREVWVKRFGPEPAPEPAERARQTRFLLARGFAADVVRRLLRSSD